ncbi:MAG: hypothetical protein CM15mP93_08390 [Thiotrichaceae bacterium]|nr:MAG: hypothetical protein CM15mP93_08390 [Thiotrichaceae bacterium]
MLSTKNISFTCSPNVETLASLIIRLLSSITSHIEDNKPGLSRALTSIVTELFLL